MKESEEKNREKCEKRLYRRLSFYLSLGLWCFSVVYLSSFNLFYEGKICVCYSLQHVLSNCSTSLYLKVSSLRAANTPTFAPVAPLLCLIHCFRVLLGIIVYSAVVRQYFKSHSHLLVPQGSCFGATATKMKTRGFLPLCMRSGESFKKALAPILLQADKRGLSARVGVFLYLLPGYRAVFSKVLKHVCLNTKWPSAFRKVIHTCFNSPLCLTVLCVRTTKLSLEENL